MNAETQLEFEPDPARFFDLNDWYYQEYGPAEYIMGRLYALVAMSSDVNTLLGLIAQGGDFWGLRLVPQPVEGDDATAGANAENERFVEHFRRIEVHSLKHLAIETLIRLFDAHRDLPDCPWLEISRERHPGPFKDKVRSSIVEGDEEQLVRDSAQVFLGSDLPRWARQLTGVKSHPTSQASSASSQARGWSRPIPTTRQSTD